MAPAKPGSQYQGIINVHRKRTKTHPQPFSCNECHASFNRLAHLRRHQRSHKGEKPYTCAYCLLSSSRKDVILRHTRNFHPSIVLPSTSDGSTPPVDAELDSIHINASSSSSATSNMSPPAQAVATQDQRDYSSNTQAEEPHTQINPGNDWFYNVLSASDLAFPDPNLYLGILPIPSLQETCRQEEDAMNNFAYDPANSSQWEVTMSPAQNIAPALPHNGQRAPQAQPSRLLPATQHDQRQERYSFSLDNDDGYEKALANLASYDPDHRLIGFRFPSKYPMLRYVKAYFEYLDLQLPMVHGPTFDIATVPSPLLIEMMACGAMYLSEHKAAANLHTTALQLVSMYWTTESHFHLWLLQTNILLFIFEVYGGHCLTTQRASSIFSCSTKLAQEGIGKLKSATISNYRDWVYQESIQRCMAATIVLGAALNSTSETQYYPLPNFDSRFSLPSTMSEWQKDGDVPGWEIPATKLNFQDTLKKVFAGESLTQEVHDFGLLTLVSAVLDHICSFETLAGAQHPHLHKSFVDEMGKSVHSLGKIWDVWTAKDTLSSPHMDAPLLKSAKSLMDSVIYHLYGHHQLTAMKSLLSSPESLKDSQKTKDLFTEPLNTAYFNRALIRAAESLRDDCRMGLQYLRRIAPHRLALLSTTSIFEGGLLLCWYLRTKRSSIPSGDPDSTLDLLISELTIELEDMQMEVMGELTTLPLVVNAEILRDDSVWAWPSTVSSKLNDLIGQFKLLP